MSIQHLFKCSANGGTYLEVNTFNRPSVFATYATWLNYYNKVTNKCKGVQGSIQCSNKICLTIIRIFFFSTVKLK